MAQIYPSLLSVPENHLDHAIKELEPFCPGFHIDIIDGRFAPNSGMSIEKTNAIAASTYRQVWVHLMVTDIVPYLTNLQLPPDSIVDFHMGSGLEAIDIIKKILEKKWLPSIAVEPKMGINEIFTYLDSLYQVTIMSVEPGFSGQPLLEDTLTKIDPLLGYRTTSNSKFKIALDGGITAKNIRMVAQKEVDTMVVGAAIFDAKVGAVQAYELLSTLVD